MPFAKNSICTQLGIFRDGDSMNKRKIDMLMKDCYELTVTALTIRKVEERLLELFSEGVLNGTIHTCIGQEWTGVAVANALQAGDTVFSNHRGHGHYIALTGDVYGLIAEIMGKDDGVCGGVGGSQHLHTENFFSNGIQGGMVPVAAGRALANALQGNNAISVVFIGDGTLGEGVIYETFNIASKWQLPLLVVLENNQYAQSTPTSLTLAGNIRDRVRGFGIEYIKCDTWDIAGLLDSAKEAVDCVRKNQKPVLLEIDTYRLKAHSKGDDLRDPVEISRYAGQDSINALLESDVPRVAETVNQIDSNIQQAITKAREATLCSFAPASNSVRQYQSVTWRTESFARQRIITSINLSLQSLLENNSKAVIIGEDIEAPYGGAFKATKDLSTLFPGRVKNTPISEGAITGVGIGLALSGFLPVVEIMFGDFMTLTFDQLLQHAGKFCEMYGKDLDVPLIIRTPMGGRRGYGPTHSQSLEKFFLGIPNLEVIAYNHRVSPALIFGNLCKTIRRPTLIIENKVLYTQHVDSTPMPGFRINISDELFPTVRISPSTGDPQVTLVCYGGMLAEVEIAAAAAFDENEVLCEIICPSIINPLNAYPILESARKTRRLITVEEGPSIAALGSEVAARILEHSLPIAHYSRIGYDSTIPSSASRESRLITNAESIFERIVEIFK